MKIILISIFVFSYFVSYGQDVSYGNSEFVGNNLHKVIEKSIKYPGSWREFLFESNSRLKEKKYFRDFKELENIKYDYSDLDSVLITRVNINRIGISESKSIRKSYFDSAKKLVLFTEYLVEDTLIPSLKEEERIITYY